MAMTAIPRDLITHVKGHITGILLTDGPEQVDTCDCCHLAWPVFALRYLPGPDTFECPLALAATDTESE